ncbi:response regulator [Catenovulum sediminis]|uniref:Response regulator n=1 Tax=Catenovulum sediminis TaxID=1740262 RepID=A0ABV1REX0_9ALTE|nr:response regulator [Catenovulum sediminis]
MKSGLTYADKSFLIVDDQRPFQIMLKGILINLGARNVNAVATGEAAISAARGRVYDFVLVDYNLGGHRKNGRQVIEELHSRKLLGPHSISIMVTGENHRPMVLGAVELQPDDYVMKPFSQNVLKFRLEKCYQKRAALIPVHRAMFDGKYDEAILECKKLIQDKSRYRNYCNNLLAELLCKMGKYQQAEYLLQKLLAHKPFTWGQIQLARTYYHQEKYSEAVRLASEVINQAPLIIDSYDLLSQALLKSGHITNSLEMAIKAVELSPYSIERQYRLCEVAQKCDMHEIVKDACKSILDMSRKSINQDDIHLLNYIRSVINAAEHTEDKSEQNKLMQEASLALQRGRHDELITHEMDYNAFEGLCRARLESLENQLLAAKKQLYAIQSKAQDNQVEGEDDPFIFDKVAVLLKIGEFETAESWIEQVANSSQNRNQFIKDNLEHYLKASESKQRAFSELNQAGIEAYKADEYMQAVNSFDQALKYAPLHTGGTLNLILAIFKLMETTGKYPEDLVKRVNKAFQSLSDIKLPTKQLERYQKLRGQYDNLIAEQSSRKN